MKKVLLLFLLGFVFLVGCEKEVANPSVNKNLPIYTTFEVGPNFINHIWALSAEQEVYEEKFEKVLKGKTYDELPLWYNFAFTHKADYLWPQIFYYIPLGYDFNTQDLWRDYFNDWEEAIETQDYKLVARYLEDSQLEPYIKNIFQTSSNEIWQSLYINQLDLLKEVSELYLKAFEDYEKKIWPEISFDLNKKILRINESLGQQDLINRWAKQTKLSPNQLQYKFSLTYISHDIFDYVQTQSGVIVCPYDLYDDAYEYIEFISQRIGYRLLTQNQNSFLHDIYQTYKPRMPDYNIFEAVDKIIEFTTAQYNGKLLGYESKIYKTILDEEPLYHALKWKYDPLNSADDILRNQIILQLDALEANKPYVLDEQVFYQKMPFEKIYSKDNWSLHYWSGLPLIINEGGQLEFLTNESTSKPVFSHDQRSIAYITPWKRNFVGKVYLMDSNNKKIEVLVSLEEDSTETIKSLAYDDKNRLYAIKGSAFGSGGGLYEINTETGALQFIEVSLEQREQLTSVHFASNQLYVKVITYNSALQIEFERRILINRDGY